VRILLDTHFWLWATSDERRISSDIRDMIQDPNNEVLVSSISIWELAIKEQIGRLRLNSALAELVKRQDFQLLPFTADHALSIVLLPLHHRDPFDRALLAQAHTEKLTLITTDQVMVRYQSHAQVKLVYSQRD